MKNADKNVSKIPEPAKKMSREDYLQLEILSRDKSLQDLGIKWLQSQTNLAEMAKRYNELELKYFSLLIEKEQRELSTCVDKYNNFCSDLKKKYEVEKLNLKNLTTLEFSSV